MKTIAVSAANGQLGRLVINQLKARVAPDEIVALVRDPAKAQDLGVAVRKADYTDPTGLEAALAGVDTLLLISGNEIGQRAVQHKNVIEASKKVGVKRIVYTSLLKADTSTLNLAPEHLETEAALKASGLSYTILRNGWYSENYTASVAAALANNAFYGSAGEGKISSAPRADLAEAAAIVLTTAGHEGKTYELAGDEAYTLSELAAEISKQSAKEIPYIDIPQADYANALKQAGLPAELAEGLAAWDVSASQGALFSNDRTLSKLLGRPTTTLAAAVKAALA
ncbi:NAD(P)-dependent oxidoreductase [Chelonobacter oris]|uniref:SDR family oxidoreductase n=1 Tax=Chelonobacter oris TaxID=505317 RepID=UPI00244D73F9|nr:SDR family oxidoreductase [Chelonobacter oris]MDH3000302.1 NAD(P)-dependent oxidoreductase [Chelonobacter oris]